VSNRLFELVQNLFHRHLVEVYVLHVGYMTAWVVYYLGLFVRRSPAGTTIR
jgi:hypothetical protein